MSVGQMSVRQMSLGQMSLGEMPVRQNVCWPYGFRPKEMEHS